MDKSKGVEFESVILLGVEEGGFWNFEKWGDEETFSFFVGLCRGKSRMIFSLCKKWLYGEDKCKINVIYEIF
ncbi:3'-5' exonuclease [Bacillus altitudinis]|uniref:3'-5' exonuclease n=1 Tax=Bacillus altitudinis TaxID=293387 RepID=UPI0011A1696E